jgi:LuxR family maltose regulon positive regulatory protein
VPAPHVHALCLAQLALLMIDEGDWEDAARLSSRARSQVTRYRLEGYATSALVLAVAALVRAHRGRLDEARADADAAAHALDQLTDLADFHEAEVRVVLARTALKLSDLNGARAQLAFVARLAARCPEAVVLQRWWREVEAEADAFAATATRVTGSLTTAELKILQFLPTHLSFREIAERSFVSGNTVKTQANAIYRKFNVCSRSEAVTLARTLGLLADGSGDLPSHDS